MYSARHSSSGARPAGFFRRQKTTELFPEESSVPLLPTSPGDLADQEEAIEEEEELSAPNQTKMGFFDNITKWDRTKRYRYLILLALSLSGDGWSYEATVIASIFQMPAWISHMGYPGASALPDWQNQWVGPVYSLGQLCGGLIAAFFLDTFGRKPTLTIGALCMNLSTALLVWSPGFRVVLAARIIEGISIGFLLLGYQIYAVEVAAKEDRGFVSSFTLMTGNFFGLLASGIIYAISYDTSNTGWRVALSVTFIPATIMLITLPWVPESPRYLYQNGKEDRCRQVLTKLYGGKFENGQAHLSEKAETEFDAMKAAISWDIKHKQDRWSSLWNTKAARYRSFVAFSSQSWWAWNGQSVFTYYYTLMFADAGIENEHTRFGIASVQNASFCVGGVIGGYLLDIWGRRTNYLIGLGQACVFLIVQGAIKLAIFDKGKKNHAAGAGFVTTYVIQWFLWVMFYSPVVNMLPAEVFSAGLRARGYAIANVFSMAVGFATQYSALPMYHTMRGWTWIFFAGCMGFAFLIVFFFYPETKGITLEEVEVVFGSGAGTVVRQALGRRASIHESGSDSEESGNPAEGNAVGLSHVPKATKKLVHIGDQ